MISALAYKYMMVKERTGTPTQATPPVVTATPKWRGYWEELKKEKVIERQLGKAIQEGKFGG
jgi:hypothetical protein